mgnify:CR=1 FL=1
MFLATLRLFARHEAISFASRYCHSLEKGNLKLPCHPMFAETIFGLRIKYLVNDILLITSNRRAGKDKD